MDRRQVLQMGAALTLLPLAGCEATTPPPAPTSPAPDPRVAKAPEPPPPATPVPDAAPAASSAPPPEAPPPATAEPAPVFTRVVGRLGKNHGHVLTVDFADVAAGAEKTYELTGKATHKHSVTLTAEHMRRLLSGEVVRTETTKGLHLHRVVARCAPAVDPPAWVNVCKFSSSGQDEHEIVVTAADMEAKVEKSYDVQGLAGHPHQLTLTAADFEKLLAGGPVTHQTSRAEHDGHLHTVTIEYKKPKA